MVIVLYFILDVPYVNSLVKILFWRIDAVLGSVHLIIHRKYDEITQHFD
jgi:hypothetical protein